ncbi:glycosyl transferase [Dokdonia pacifica]|uniref:Glycosyltransferase involved in cell wall bisynthesis n=1 Tax=Dokdonia pacifica TaxID=1627892 RepID=A0A239BRH6_9FLAO|nr:glycosyltransferase [Dokdonia pacifica]GGG27862.1 glycosyl transferase [Dokdonia pacifica]SNS10570.1 Glycosyltransferase involved in cell wall bisynthesis [Dokdonia pacifica]
MNFLIITHVKHKLKDDHYYGYGPYVKEMNIWNAHVDHVEVVGHKIDEEITRIDLPYTSKVRFTEIPQISLTSLKAIFTSFFYTPIVFFKIIGAIRRADHIHLRCPGNIGLLGCIAQIFFPKKKKTAKYAGNWDPKAKQPRSYRLQKWILQNTFLTKNISVLAYGDWPDQSKNIVSFFTATYRKEQIPEIKKSTYSMPFHIMFVGSLVPGKRPMYALEFVKTCFDQGIDVKIDFYGEGNQRPLLEKYIQDHQLQEVAVLHGNQTTETVQEAYKKSHFLLLPSKSEGWPKVVAEAMFWGVIPIVTPISCVSWMLGEGSRGILMNLNLESDVTAFAKAIKTPEILQKMTVEGQEWSHQYTLDTFESSIKELL